MLRSSRVSSSSPSPSPSLNSLNDFDIQNIGDEEFDHFAHFDQPETVSEYTATPTYNYSNTNYNTNTNYNYSTTNHSSTSFDIGVIDACLRDGGLEASVYDATSEHLNQQQLDTDLEYSLERHNISLSDLDDDENHAHSHFNQQSEVKYDQESEEELEDELSHLSALENEIGSGETATLRVMLDDAMGEVERLKRENLELLEQREADQKHIDDLSESLVYNKNMYLETTEQLKLDLTSKLTNLESENKSLKDEIQHLRSSQDQISSIRQTLMEEKDMDILNLRVQLMSEKEKQLRDLKTQMEREKDATSVKLQHEIQAIKDAFQTERQDLLEEMNQLQQLIDHLRIEVELKSHHVVSNTIFTQTDSDLVPRQDLDDYKSIVQELAGMFGINSLSEPLTIKTVIINYINDMDSKLDAQSRDLTTKTSQLNDLKNDMKALTKQTEQWELNHAATLQSLQQAHSTSLSTLKQSYDHQLATLTEKTASLIDPTTLKSWHDLETAFPTFFTAYKSEIQNLVETDTAALFQRVKESVDQEKQNLKAFFDRSLEVERVRLRERFDGDVAGAVKDVKEKCAVAYEEAVRKLKSEYVRLEQVCRRRVEEMGVEEERLRGVVKEQEEYIASMEVNHRNQLEQIKNEYNGLLNRVKEESRIQYSAQLKHALEKMKQKYVEAIRNK